MKLKCKKSWLPNGDIVLVVKDHDAPVALPRGSKYTTGVTDKSVWESPFWEQPARKPVLERVVLPRGTPRKEVDNAKKALILTCELRNASL